MSGREQLHAADPGDDVVVEPHPPAFEDAFDDTDRAVVQARIAPDQEADGLVVSDPVEQNGLVGLGAGGVPVAYLVAVVRRVTVPGRVGHHDHPMRTGGVAAQDLLADRHEIVHAPLLVGHEEDVDALEGVHRRDREIVRSAGADPDEPNSHPRSSRSPSTSR